MLEVVKPGLLCTVQDGGRYGYQHLGVGPAGPMNWVGAQLANITVDNPPDAPLLEICGGVTELRFTRTALVCRVGGRMSVEGSDMPVNRPVVVPAQALVRLTLLDKPGSSYLAVAGGLLAPQVLGSASASTVVSLGVYNAKGLLRGTKLPLGKPSVWAQTCCDLLIREGRAHTTWSVKPLIWTRLYEALPIRVIRDTRSHFSDLAWKQFLAGSFRVLPASNRMGLRLEGAPIEANQPSVRSHGVVTGTIQVPANGQPVVLMVDRQTTGGYPVLGHVAACDLPLLSAKSSGAFVRFQEISLAQAEAEQQQLKQSLARRQNAMRIRPPL